MSIAPLGPDPIAPEPQSAPEPEIAAIGERSNPIMRIPWRTEIRALLTLETRALEAKDLVVSTLKALVTSPTAVREERARILAEERPGLEVTTQDGRELSTNDTADGARYLRLRRPHGTSERPVDLTELIVPEDGGRVSVQLGVHDTRGPLGFRNADLVGASLAEAGAIIDAAQASPAARESDLSLPRLQLLEDDMAAAATEAARLTRTIQQRPLLADLRVAYRAALDARAAGDDNDTAFQDASARVREGLDGLGLPAADADLVRAELQLCQQIRDKWIDWHGSTGVRTLYVPM
jgi:hypothetical protein